MGTMSRRILLAMILGGRLSPVYAAEAAELIPLPVVFPSAHLTEGFWRRMPSLPQRVHDELLKSQQDPKQLPQVPKDVRNLALHAVVTASDTEPVIGELAMVTDGDKSASSASFIELGPGSQWVQIDLKTPAAVWAVVLWHFHGDLRVYRAVVVQVADDAAFTVNVRTLFNNDANNANGLGIGTDTPYPDTNLGRVIPAQGVSARHVRCWSRGNTVNDLNHYVEVEVWGR
jgi:hypothetical protein